MATFVISDGFENELGDFLGITDVGLNGSYVSKHDGLVKHGDYAFKVPHIDGNVINFTGAAFTSANPYISFWMTVPTVMTAGQSMRVVHDITAGVVLDIHILRDAGGDFQLRFEYSDVNTGYQGVGTFTDLAAEQAWHHIEAYGEGSGVGAGTGWIKWNRDTVATIAPSAEAALTSFQFGRIDTRNWGADSYQYFDSFEMWDGVPAYDELKFQTPPNRPGGQATGQRRSVIGPGSVGGL